MSDEQSPVGSIFEEPVPAEGAYFRWLRSIEPESLRRAWLDGDFNALMGAYFRMFRPNGPLSGEPPEANHVYDPAEFQPEPWWHTWMSMDWGYIHPTAIHYHKKGPDGRIYTFREIGLNRVEPFELGVMVARDAEPYIKALESKHITLYLSPDAYDKRESEDTVASQMAAGIVKVWGPRSVFLMDFDEAEREMKEEEALNSLLSRREEQKQTRLTITRANNNRVAGWMHMQTLLRFTPLEPESKPDMEYAHRLGEEKGIVAQLEYMNLPEFSKPREVLPRWKISRECYFLIRTMPMAMHKPGTNDLLKWDATETTPGDDHLDCFIRGTLIQTENGEVPIQCVRRGDRVYTRNGLREVLLSGPTREKDLYTAKFSDGTELTGSGGHPILIGGKWKRLDSLRYGDIITKWQKSSSLMASSSGGILSHRSGILGSTTGPLETTDMLESGRYTRRFGKSIMGALSPQGIISTIRTKIRSTMIRPIWWLSGDPIIWLSAIGDHEGILSTWPVPENLLRRGTPAKMGEPGTENTKRSLLGDIENPPSCAASSAGLSSCPGHLSRLSSALITASRWLGVDRVRTWFREFALSAESSSYPISMTAEPAAPVHVVGVIRGGRDVVFNLAVEDTPEYFANGVLVHNCARYGLLSEEHQKYSIEPLSVRVDRRVEQFSGPGYSDHSRIMARQQAMYLETVGKKKQAQPYLGHNRLAVQRAMNNDRARELTKQMMSRRVQ